MSEINLTIDNLYNICRLICVFTERKIHLSLSEMIAALQTLGYDYREGVAHLIEPVGFFICGFIENE